MSNTTHMPQETILVYGMSHFYGVECLIFITFLFKTRVGNYGLPHLHAMHFGQVYFFNASATPMPQCFVRGIKGKNKYLIGIMYFNCSKLVAQ